MIIGNGMMANVFERYSNDNDVVIFASGVSNSKTKEKDAFHREEVLLRKTIKENSGKIIVYFSTCSIYDDSVNKTEYVLHKKNMENLIHKLCQHFYIFRLPQVVGKTKSPTLVNFLFTSIINNEKISLNKNSTRNLIDANDIYKIVDYLIKNKLYSNEITNIATPNNDFVLDIVLQIEKITKVKANYTLVELGEKQDIDISKIRSLDVDFNIFHDNYQYSVLYKYFIDSLS